MQQRYFHGDHSGGGEIPKAAPTEAPKPTPETNQELLRLLTSLKLKELQAETQLTDANAVYGLRYAQLKYLLDSGKTLYTDSTKRTELSATQRTTFLQTVETLMKDPSKKSDATLKEQYALLQNVLIGNQDLFPENYKHRIAAQRIIGLPVVEENEEVEVMDGEHVHPLKGKGVVTSHKGPRWGRQHEGVDLGAPQGTPVVSWAGGKVIYVQNQNEHGYGNWIAIAHPDGTTTRYAHLSKVTVSLHDTVTAGQQIGNVGATGGTSTGPHLHFEIRKGSGLSNGIPQDPEKIAKAHGIDFSAA